MRELDRYRCWLNNCEVDGSLQSRAFWTQVAYLNDTIHFRSRDSSLSDKHLPWFIKVVSHLEEELVVLITDFTELWSEKLSFADFSAKLSALNPNLECDTPTIFFAIVESLLLGQSDADVKVEHGAIDDPYLKIFFKSTYDAFPFFWELHGSKCSPVEMRNPLINPLVASIVQYQRREEELKKRLLFIERELKRNGDKNLFSASGWHTEDLKSEAFFSAVSPSCNAFPDPFKNNNFRDLFCQVERLLVYNATMPINQDEGRIEKEEDVQAGAGDQSATTARSANQEVASVTAAAVRDHDERANEHDGIIQTDRPTKRRKILRL